VLSCPVPTSPSHSEMVPDPPDADEEEFPQASRRIGSTLAAPAIARNLPPWIRPWDRVAVQVLVQRGMTRWYWRFQSYCY
jgi:hypothetical protein